MEPAHEQAEEPQAVRGTVLAGRGVETQLYRTRELQPADPAEPAYAERETAGDAYIIETKWLRLGVNEMAALEARYGSQQAWQQAVNDRPNETIRATFAVAFRMSETRIGEALIDGKITEYVVAVETAWMLAQGIDPKRAARFCQNGVTTGRRQTELQAEIMELEIGHRLETAVAAAEQAAEAARARVSTTSGGGGSQPTETPNSSGG